MKLRRNLDDIAHTPHNNPICKITSVKLLYRFRFALTSRVAPIIKILMCDRGVLMCRRANNCLSYSPSFRGLGVRGYGGRGLGSSIVRPPISLRVI